MISLKFNLGSELLFKFTNFFHSILFFLFCQDQFLNNVFVFFFCSLFFFEFLSKILLDLGKCSIGFFSFLLSFSRSNILLFSILLDILGFCCQSLLFERIPMSLLSLKFFNIFSLFLFLFHFFLTNTGIFFVYFTNNFINHQFLFEELLVSKFFFLFFLNKLLLNILLKF